MVHQPAINSAAMNCSQEYLAVASSAAGTKISFTGRDNKCWNKVTLTFFEVQKRNNQGKFVPDGNIAYLKHIQSLEIDKLKLKDKPKINHIRFQAASSAANGSSKSETMILCTHYGLLIYEWTLIPEHLKKS